MRIDEKDEIIEIIDLYYEHFKENKDSLLVKIFGIYEFTFS